MDKQELERQIKELDERIADRKKVIRVCERETIDLEYERNELYLKENSITVGELIMALGYVPPDTPIVIGNADGRFAPIPDINFLHHWDESNILVLATYYQHEQFDLKFINADLRASLPEENNA